MGVRSPILNSVLSPTCPHGLRPGTTVCLHCRAEARAKQSKERWLIAARFGIATAGVGVVLAVLIGGVMAIAPDASSSAAPVDSAAPIVAQASKAARPALVVAKPAVRPEPPRVVPTISEGRRELGDSMFAIREGNQVTVHFDTEERRTRHDWKFEDVVRATLPAVFGPEVRAALDSVPEGTFARGGDLLNELPTRGIALEMPDGQELLRVWPITRPGRDGPLVVAYRVAGSAN
jgi:hypothetical protein